MVHHLVDQHICYETLRRRREKRAERIFECIMSENIPNLMKDINVNIQEAKEISSKMNPKSLTSRHIIIKFSKDKERILKVAKEK